MGFIAIYSFIGPINSFVKLNFDQNTHFIYSLKKYQKMSTAKSCIFFYFHKVPLCDFPSLWAW